MSILAKINLPKNSLAKSEIAYSVLIHGSDQIPINSTTTLSLPHRNANGKTRNSYNSYVHLLYEFLVFPFVVRCSNHSVVVGFMSTYYMSSWHYHCHIATRTGRPGTHIIGGHTSYYNTITATSHHEQEDQEGAMWQ
jgi:uncharacterized membrane protein